MRGMLLIVIAVFIPPTLTYLGIVGGGADSADEDLPASAEYSHSGSDSTRQNRHEPSL